MQSSVEIKRDGRLSYAEQEERIAQLEEQLRHEKQCRIHAEDKAVVLENVFQALPTAIFYKDLQGIYLNCNKAFAEIKGIFQHNIIGKTVFDVASQERAEGCSEVDEALRARGGGSLTYELTINPEHGRQRDVIFSKAIFLGADGEPAGVVGLMSDITEVNRRKHQLVKLKTKYQSLLETIPHGIIELDTEGIITYSNNAFKQMVGREDAPPEGLNLKDLLKPVEDESCSGECLTNFLHNKLSTASCKAKVSSHTGRIFDVQLDWSYKYNENRDVIGFILIATDMTERNQAEEKLKRYQVQLRSLSSQLSLVEARGRRKIATELHDNLGQNLVLAKFKIKSLKSMNSSPQLTSELNSVEQSIEAAISFARSLTAEVSPLILYSLDFESSVEWLADNILAPCQIKFRIKTDDALEELSEDTQVLLFEAVRELFVNIVKHAQAKNVHIYLKNIPEGLQVQVEDDGRGFVYDPESELEDYSGFGLFSIRERIKYLQGKIRILTSLGQGTCVQFQVPKESSKMEGTV
ncbi:PAS domain S-box-containing protein [Desulfuromusa kysingii]|uniref:PAS domain S-box-containing protein n=1 Tax=Desulfuromusa kysingii TaxID=37625 RepID=A0A1H4AUI9_9BACT|nr:PAS domain S-box protein [Desulfuromusa kysingii]SEA39467.1 PAS domain S-box-containing protein [Desulfuromusa kysingii]